ncbi:hypothetical protein [Methylophaga sulfidovorans]|uniref:Uncharacterized protein n=1 Tax=Methylophaga sulfidovorans TaxID=45496 RepID=A0A1I3U7K0_9GAMM|nr:hypothetical protein [Methylophaga sulfidovorans]SFJ78902.1 hypothetical protein SAMN04488079_101216 [Methylophaga sulfidovorans]
MKTAQFNTQGRHSIHLAFDENKLETLIREGKLHAADFNCLDRSSKKTVWNMLLSTAARKLKS